MINFGFDIGSLARFGYTNAVSVLCSIANDFKFPIGGILEPLLIYGCAAGLIIGLASFFSEAGKAYSASVVGGTACVSYKFGVFEAGQLGIATGGAAPGVALWALGELGAFTYNAGKRRRDLYG